MNTEYSFARDRRICAANAASQTLNSYPKFRHKWTRRLRSYEANELAVDGNLNFDGNFPAEGRLRIGIGGTRSPCVETFCAVAEMVGNLCALDVAILSGGVPGVDLSAHIAAVSHDGGCTLAVMANPVGLGLGGHEWSSGFINDRIRATGGFVSEYSVSEEQTSDAFRERLLARDRIITALSDVFVAFECSVDSATVDTARRALLQGKPVVAVESVRLTRRQGIDQIETELGVRKLSMKDLSIAEIAREIRNLGAAYYDTLPTGSI